jgi:hypothetical protein
VNEAIVTPVAAEPSACSCDLPRGAWGSGGWHHFRYDRATLFAKAKREFEATNRGGGHEFKYDPARWDPYIGAPFAYEPCPHYRKAVRTSINEQRARRQASEAPMYDER